MLETQDELAKKRIEDTKARVLKKLAEIVDKGVTAFTKADIAYLRARRTYLNMDQREKVASVLEPKKTDKKSK